MQKDFTTIVFCLLFCMIWYFSGITRSSLHICTVVKLNNHTWQLQYGWILIRYSPLLVLLEWKQSYKNNPNQQMVVLYKPLSLQIRQPDWWESTVTQSYWGLWCMWSLKIKWCQLRNLQCVNAKPWCSRIGLTGVSKIAQREVAIAPLMFWDVRVVHFIWSIGLFFVFLCENKMTERIYRL